MTESHPDAVRARFERAAPYFAERTAGRFDRLDPVAFARVEPGTTVVEVGAGTANFLALFAPVAERLVAVDLTAAMLEVARKNHPSVHAVVADGARLPFASGSLDFVATAQALHHIWRPVEVLRELRRVVGTEGKVLIVDSVATESFEEAAFMNELDRLRDPSHAAFRSPTTMRTLARSAGLEVEDERIVEEEQRLSRWMWPGEFEESRIQAVRDYVREHGDKTGMEWRVAGDDLAFTRRRMMLLARRGGRDAV